MEAVIFCGIQASGKSTFYKERFADTHLRLNMDMLRTRYREALLLDAFLRAKQPFVVDNTNPTAAERARYIGPARAARFRVVGFFFEVLLEEALLRNAGRNGRERIPERGVRGTFKRFEVPHPEEGYDELYRVVSLHNAGYEITRLHGPLGKV